MNQELRQWLLHQDIVRFLNSERYRTHKNDNHPLFPRSTQVNFSSNPQKILLCLPSYIHSVEDAENQYAQIKIMIELSDQPEFLKLHSYSITQLPNSQQCQVNVFLEYGGSSLQKYIRMKGAADCPYPIIPEEQIWIYLKHMTRALKTLDSLGLHHGHLHFYSIRVVDQQIKILFDPLSMPQFIDLVSAQPYYKMFLSPEQLADLSVQSLESDVFSLGILILNMCVVQDLCNLCYIQSDLTMSLNTQNIDQKLNYVSSYYSTELLQLLGQMMSENPETRINVHTLGLKIESHLEKMLKIRKLSTDIFFKYHYALSIGSVKYTVQANKSNKKPGGQKKTEKKPMPVQQNSNEEVLHAIEFRGTFGKSNQQIQPIQAPILRYGPANTSQNISSQPKKEEPNKGLNIKIEDQEEEQLSQRKAPTMSSVIQQPAATFIQTTIIKQEIDNSTNKIIIKIDDTPQQSETETYSEPKSVIVQRSEPQLGSMNHKQQNPQPNRIQNQWIESESTKKQNQQLQKQKQELLLKLKNAQRERQLLMIQMAVPNSKQVIIDPKTDRRDRSSISVNAFTESPISQYKDEPSQVVIELATIPKPQYLSTPPITVKPEATIQNFKPRRPLPSQPKTKKQLPKLRSLDELISTFKTPGVMIKDNIYYGAIRNRRRQGLGLQIYPNGEYYYGQYQNDLFQGRGLYFWSPKQYFSGTFYRGVKKNGVMVIKSRVYIGALENNMRHGFGVAYYPDYIYEGEWNQGKKHGEGTVFYKNGDVFQGNFREGHRSGPGVLKLQDSVQIEGEWQRDDVQGKAEIRYINGDVYRGTYQKSMKSGQGEYIYAKGGRFVGIFKDDAMVQGIIYYPDSSVYTGEVNTEGKRHGKGKYVYPNGDSYVGDWVSNYRHGYGIMTDFEYIYEGEWKMGERQGLGITTQKSKGKVIKGMFQKNTLVSILK